MKRLKQLQHFVGELPLLGDVSVWLYNRLRGTLDTKAAYWISRLITASEAQFVQIGSNDGKSGADPLNRLLKTRKKWKALFVEPVPYLFARLRANYGNASRFAFENAAINDGRQATFYWVPESAKAALPNLPAWAEELGSFDRNHIIKHVPEVEPFIQAEEINGLTLEQLFAKHRLRHIDVLHIDTEGHDYKILSQLDLETIRPAIILFEHLHLAPEEKAASIRFLSGRYELFEWGMDMLAISQPLYLANRALLHPLEKYRVVRQANS